jgi:hypothetical protein
VLIYADLDNDPVQLEQVIHFLFVVKY